jgi:hypothetical protein
MNYPVDGGITIVDNIYFTWGARSTAQTANTTSGATVITTGTAVPNRLGVYITNLSSTVTIVLGIAESLGGSTPTVWEIPLPPSSSIPLNLPPNVAIYAATTSGSATFCCKEFR